MAISRHATRTIRDERDSLLIIASQFDNLNTNLPFTFRRIFQELQDKLLASPPVDVGEWQSQKIEVLMRELLHVVFEWRMPDTKEELAALTGARLPWAEDHFLERVGGEPLNPAPSEAWWPFAARKDGTNVAHKSEGEAFSHTYPERMWPKFANGGDYDPDHHSRWEPGKHILQGVRFGYGDLRDVVMQLYRSRNTRQAYLPIWFPEDTGAVHGKRVPCTLGYHFIIRDNTLDVSYFMRSTDLLRHFQDDVYLAVRLAQWVAEQVMDYHWSEGHPDDETHIKMGKLIFHTANMHIFDADVAMINHWRSQGRIWF